MARKIVAVVATEVEVKGKVSYKFMHTSKAPREMLGDLVNMFGVLTLEDKPADFINPFRLARGEPNAIGPDGVRSWNLNVFSVEKSGQIFCGVCDEDAIANEDHLQAYLMFIPDSVILTHESARERLEIACQHAGIELVLHHYDGVLATA